MHKKYTKNISIIDKLVLAIVKTFNVDEATAWVEGKKQDLIKLDTVTENAFNEISENKGIEIAKFIKNISPDNMYILCKSKISEVGELINSNGALYLDFESALPYYEKNGILTGNDPETTEFNDIMNFLYMGRKEKIKEDIQIFDFKLEPQDIAQIDTLDTNQSEIIDHYCYATARLLNQYKIHE